MITKKDILLDLISLFKIDLKNNFKVLNNKIIIRFKNGKNVLIEI